jgi:hypothetical protein
MLEALATEGIKMSYLERALELPARTTTRWKSGEVSAATLALLRITRTYPWILEVADSHFDERVVKCRLVEEAAHVLDDWFKPHKKQVQCLVSTEEIDVSITIDLSNPSPFRSMKPKLERTLSIGGDE